MKKSEIIICYACKGTGEGLHNEGICRTCEGSGRLKQIVTYEKYKSVADEALKIMSDEDKKREDQEKEFQKAFFEELLNKGLVKNKSWF